MQIKFLIAELIAQSPLLVVMGVILSVLTLLLFILVVNLLTFRRLRPLAVVGTDSSRPFSSNALPCGRDESVLTTAVTFMRRGVIHHAHMPSRLVSQGVIHHAPTHDIPTLSILVPARNEEQCIEACVRSLVQQDYERLEVLVLDDGSTDATVRIVQGLIETLPLEQKGRLRLLHGEPLPDGWVGKNFACAQLAHYAQGEYLLFTDADTVHAPQMASTVLAAMQKFRVELLTAQPEFELKSLGERLIIPLLNFTIMTLLPVALILVRPESSLATGNGQLLCFRRVAYEKIGGHTAVKGRILEDVLLARAIKAAGLRMIFVDAQALVRCRMYHSFTEVWQGFSKNLFAFYNYSPIFALLALLLNLALFVLPCFLLLLAPFIALSATTLLCAGMAYLLPIIMRVLLTLRFNRSQRASMLLLCVLHPISIVLECFILLNSMRWRYRKTGTVWKGRQYSTLAE